MIAGTIWSFFIHANLRGRLGPLEWLISTSVFHHLHLMDSEVLATQLWDRCRDFPDAQWTVA
jgi:sterol desaturase/sphingolipid hydroxylase (fatty acid hydroxylase superfamily)